MVPAELPSGDAGDLPLAVDLDGTLIRSDTLVENWLSALRTAPLTALAAPFYLLRGKAFMKARLAAVADIDAARLPYNEDFLGYLKAEKARGRQLILATASHIDTARKIADHLGLFDDVIGTGATSNLRGPAKAAVLRERFGQKGFAYAYADQYVESNYDYNKMSFEEDAYGYVGRDEHISAYLGADNSRGAVYAKCKD